MGDILPPPSTGVPAVNEKTRDFTPIWRQWFVKVAEVINRSGGTGGSVPSSRVVNTVFPLEGGGNLSQDRAITIVPPGPNNAILKKSGTTIGFEVGISVTIITARRTGAGAEGSMTFTNGVLTAQVQAT